MVLRIQLLGKRPLPRNASGKLLLWIASTSPKSGSVPCLMRLVLCTPHSLLGSMDPIFPGVQAALDMGAAAPCAPGGTSALHTAVIADC